MNRFIKDVKKYYRYSKYSAKSELKTEVAGSYLNWLWWILDPILFMLVYTFVVLIVFGGSKNGDEQQCFPVFVFIGLTCWNYFNKVVTSSVKLVKNNKSVVTKVYIPKYVLIFIKMGVNLFKTTISFILVFIFMIIFKVHPTLHILNFLSPLIVLMVVTFGISCIVMHFGVFIEDMANIMQILLRLLFYVSGVFYSLTRIPDKYGNFEYILINFNPMAAIIEQFRCILLYGTAPDYKILGIWLVIGLILSAIGIHTVYKYENSYAKVI